MFVVFLCRWSTVWRKLSSNLTEEWSSSVTISGTSYHIAYSSSRSIYLCISVRLISLSSSLPGYPSLSVCLSVRLSENLRMSLTSCESVRQVAASPASCWEVLSTLCCHIRVHNSDIHTNMLACLAIILCTVPSHSSYSSPLHLPLFFTSPLISPLHLHFFYRPHSHSLTPFHLHSPHRLLQQVAEEIWVIDKGLHVFDGDIRAYKASLKKIHGYKK